MVRAEDVAGPEWADWYALSPQQRFQESEKLWHAYLAFGGSLDPEPDTHSPFFDRSETNFVAYQDRLKRQMAEIDERAR
jgi:hypothetical protein